MRLFRWIGWLFIFAAVAVAGSDAIKWLETRTYAPVPLGQLWAWIDRPSLNLVQAVTERYAAPWLWHDVLFPVVQSSAALVFAVPGVVLAFLFRRPRA